MTQLKSQAIGLLLALATAISCMFYEKIVNNFSYLTLITLYFLFQIPILYTAGYFVFENDLKVDYQKFISDPMFFWLSLGRGIFISITSICWFYITKNQSVMVGSIYEIKYIVILALLYIAFGDAKFTWNTAIGLCLALGSVYFISKD